MRNSKAIHMVLGGGGVKGIAYIGVFETAEKYGIQLGNLAGVSAGAVSGAIAAAGYPASEQKGILQRLDFGKIVAGEIPEKIPLVARYLTMQDHMRNQKAQGLETFIQQELYGGNYSRSIYPIGIQRTRNRFFENLIKLCKEGCLFDGDYLEEWIYRVLIKRGIRTFEDLRGGITDSLNPNGYKMRMTAVDADRGRIIILPDDIAYYDIQPGALEVAKAIRMSTCVPFAFKPVELKKKVGKGTKTYHLVDGGVLDNLPYWLVNHPTPLPSVAFRFRTAGKKNLLSIDTPLHILKFFLSSVHDIGVPNKNQKMKNVVDIDTSKVSAMDFNLNEEEKEYLYIAGKDAAERFFQSFTRGDNKRFRFLSRYF